MSSLSALQRQRDEHYMNQALSLARQSAGLGEVPVGALLVVDEAVQGTGTNRCVLDHDPTAHAEVVAMRKAAAAIKQSRLDGATLYVTLEPCLMCCGAILQARIARLVFGAREPRTGGVLSIHEAFRLPAIKHHVAVTEGVLADESSELMRTFFEQLR